MGEKLAEGPILAGPGLMQTIKLKYRQKGTPTERKACNGERVCNGGRGGSTKKTLTLACNTWAWSRGRRNEEQEERTVYSERGA